MKCIGPARSQGQGAGGGALWDIVCWQMVLWVLHNRYGNMLRISHGPAPSTCGVGPLERSPVEGRVCFSASPPHKNSREGLQKTSRAWNKTAIFSGRIGVL